MITCYALIAEKALRYQSDLKEVSQSGTAKEVATCTSIKDLRRESQTQITEENEDEDEDKEGDKEEVIKEDKELEEKVSTGVVFNKGSVKRTQMALKVQAKQIRVCKLPDFS